MDVTHLIPRRLDLGSCIIVGTQLAADIKAYKEQQKTIPAELEESAQSVIAVSQELETLSEADYKMVEIDHATDRCVTAWDDLHDAIQRILDGEGLLSLTKEENELRITAKKIHSASYPEGTAFIRYTFRRQWLQLQKVKKALVSLKSELTTSGLWTMANRLIRWIDLYGARLGITENSEEFTDKAVLAIERWHQALGSLFFELINYSRSKQTDAQELNTLLTTPYEKQAEAERREARERQKKRKAKEATPIE